MQRLTKKKITKAVARSARKHGYSRDTVRTNTFLFIRALDEYCKATRSEILTGERR